MGGGYWMLSGKKFSLFSICFPEKFFSLRILWEKTPKFNFFAPFIIPS